MDTIFALSSGAPPAGIAIIRISGVQAFAAIERIAGRLPAPRHARLRTLRDAAGRVLDHGLVLLFPGPASATGEDLGELHLHGGRAIVRAVCAALGALPGLREALPGEFTRRALENGRIDLTEAEGLGDLLTAETEGQRRAALAIAEGGLRRRVEHWCDRLIAIAAQVEADIDFSDEDDVPAASLDAVLAAAANLVTDMAAALAQPPVERWRDGIRVVLAGPPNSGKSTLFNALIQREAAIVSPIAGTTRDRIDAPVTRDGIPYLLTDTAGLALATDDMIEAIGIDRARRAIEQADLILWLGDDAPPYPAIWLHSRADLPDRATVPADRDLSISSMDPQRIEALWVAIAGRAQALLPATDNALLNAQQRVAVDQVKQLLSNLPSDHILIAEHLRAALGVLHRITGRGDVDEMLDTLFSRFCIGK